MSSCSWRSWGVPAPGLGGASWRRCHSLAVKSPRAKTTSWRNAVPTGTQPHTRAMASPYPSSLGTPSGPWWSREGLNRQREAGHHRMVTAFLLPFLCYKGSANPLWTDGGVANPSSYCGAHRPSSVCPTREVQFVFARTPNWYVGPHG